MASTLLGSVTPRLEGKVASDPVQQFFFLMLNGCGSNILYWDSMGERSSGAGMELSSSIRKLSHSLQGRPGCLTSVLLEKKKIKYNLLKILISQIYAKSNITSFSDSHLVRQFPSTSNYASAPCTALQCSWPGGSSPCSTS